MRIGIDARAVHFPGIGRYIRELVKHLSQVDSTNQYYLYIGSAEHRELLSPGNSNFHFRMVPARMYSAGEQAVMTWHARKDGIEVFHSTTSLVVPLLKPCRLVVTFHDLILKVMPEFLPSRLAALYFNIMNLGAVRLSDRIISVSHFTAGELSSLYPRARSKIHVVQHGVDGMFRPLSDRERVEETLKRYGLQPGYFLYVGTYKRHKNLPSLVKAYSQLTKDIRDCHPLVILGKKDERYGEVPRLLRDLDLGKYAIRLDPVPEEDLPSIYNGAMAFVILSLYEGFGFPLLEAMACGVPVIASSIPPFREVAGDAAHLVAPLDVPAVTDALRRLAVASDLRSAMREKGLARAKGFSWIETASKVIDVYRSAYGA